MAGPMVYADEYHADAPNILKKELSHILTIQGEFESLEKTVRLASASIKNGRLPKSSLDHVNVMLDHLGTIRERADKMYATLNVNDDFPSLAGVDLEFVRRLFLLCQLKATVQKKATSTMWEFDKLDQASGGKDMALGEFHRASSRVMRDLLTPNRNENASARPWRNVEKERRVELCGCSVQRRV